MTLELLRAGKLEQTCPTCGRWEAAGRYCTGCGRQTGPADWYPNADLGERTRRGAVRDNSQHRAGKSAIPLNRGRGRPGRVSAPEAVS